LEVVALVASPSNEFILSRALRNLEAVAVKVVLELGVGPGVEDGVLGGVGLLGEIRCYRSISGAAGCGGSGVGLLSGGDELLAGRTSLLTGFFSSLVSRRCKVCPMIISLYLAKKIFGLLQVVNSPGIENPGRPFCGGLMLVQTNSSEKLIFLSVLRNRNSTGVEVCLQSSFTPASNSRVPEIFSFSSGIISSLCVCVSSRAGGSTIGGCT
jgi:hypothetical protein